MRSAGRSAGDVAQILAVLEGQNAGEADIEAELHGFERQIAAAGEAMQDGREGALPGFFRQNARHVGVGFAGMDHQRQAGLARRSDVLAEALFLRVARAFVVVIVEPGFADGDDFRMLRQLSPAPWRRCPVPHGRCADGCRPSRKYPGISQRSARTCGELLHPG